MEFSELYCLWQTAKDVLRDDYDGDNDYIVIDETPFDIFEFRKTHYWTSIGCEIEFNIQNAILANPISTGFQKGILPIQSRKTHAKAIRKIYEMTLQFDAISNSMQCNSN